MSVEPTPTPTPTPAPTATPTPTPTPTPTGDTWTSKFDDETKGYVQNKGFKEPGDLLHSYRNLEKLVGADPNSILKLPQKDDAPEWGGIWERLGVPKDAKEYSVQFPKEVDAKAAEEARALFKAAGLTNKQADTIYKGFLAQQQQLTQAQIETYNAKVQQDDVSLKKEWGQAYQQNIAAGQRAAKALGFTAETIEAIERSVGFAGTMKLFQGLGMKLTEDSFHRGDGNTTGFGNALSPEAAKAKIVQLKSDPGFTSKYLGGDQGAIQEMNRLHEMAEYQPPTN